MTDLPEGFHRLKRQITGSVVNLKDFHQALDFLEEMAEVLEQANEYPSSDGMILVKQKPIIDLINKFRKWK